MFLLAPIVLSVLALLPALCAAATGNKAAIRAAAEVAKRPDTGMPESAQTNHPVPLREARVTSDASSPPASAGVCPASESDDLETPSTTADAPAYSFHPSASPHSMRGLALGVGHDWAGRPRLPLPQSRRAYGPDQASCTASPRPRLKAGDAAGVEVGAACTTRTALI